MNVTKIIYVFSVILLITGCASKSNTNSRYSMEHDAIPQGAFDASTVPNAIPKWEPLSRQGNKSPYQVRGITYHLVDTSKGFVEEGIASWYGLKFHGELTSNGEIYNTYGMTAAHKHLPLPSYVKVINLENGRDVIVRVNDRGPFHRGRVIDLSFAAAKKLGFADKGTANVRVELIQLTPDNVQLSDGSNKSVAMDKLAYFIQVAAFSEKQAAEFLKSDLKQFAGAIDVFVASAYVSGTQVHRLRLGPFESESEANAYLAKLKSRGYKGSQVIQRALSAKES